MNQINKIVLTALTVSVFGISLRWAIVSHWDFEPVLALIASIMQLIGIWKGDDIAKGLSVKDIDKSTINVELPANADGTITIQGVKNESEVTVKSKP